MGIIRYRGFIATGLLFRLAVSLFRSGRMAGTIGRGADGYCGVVADIDAGIVGVKTAIVLFLGIYRAYCFHPAAECVSCHADFFAIV